MNRERILVIGHAGAAGVAPANTLASVQACIDAGAHGMEIDVQLTSDDVPVLLHDTTLDRTTNLTGPIREHSFAEVEAADAGGGESVPSLADVLALVAGRLSVMCELKATPGDDALDSLLTDRVADVIADAEAAPWTAIQSCQREIVERSREVAPSIPVTRISAPQTEDQVEQLISGTVRRGAQAISVRDSSITPALVLSAKQRHLTVWTWTPDSADEWDRVIDAGVDGIITNYPKLLVEHLGTRA
jgi:glycerophosphoryl diester phosphodiesterase